MAVKDESQIKKPLYVGPTTDNHPIWETKPGLALSGNLSKSQGRNAYTKLTTAESAAGGNKISSKKSRNRGAIG